MLSFGLGNNARPGGWVPIQLRVIDRSGTPRELIVVLELTDQDGDRPRYETVVPAADVRGRDVWLAAPIPPDFDDSSVLSFSVYEGVETGREQRPFAPGELLLRAPMAPAQPDDGRPAARLIHPADGMIGVVGRRTMGLAAYATRTAGEPWAPLHHERTEIVSGLNPADLPDHWSGYTGLDALVWSAGEPQELGLERPDAIAAWVRRGGHLVIVLPSVGQAWLTPSGNPLARRGLLPDATVVRHETDMPPSDWLPLLGTGSRQGTEGRPAAPVTLGAPVPVHEFVIERSAPDRAAMPILADRAGRVVVVRRLVGLGMVTMIGLDVGARELGRHGLPRAEVFWNRVLGRRGQFKLPDEVRRLEGLNAWTLTNRMPLWYDADIPSLIAKTGRSAAGLLLGFVVFGLYWIVAGPGGFAALKWLKRTQHAWVAFVLTGAVFAVISWGGALAIRPKSVEAQHLTVVDHVYLQPVQRATTWMSLLVPSYGEATLRVGREQDARAREEHAGGAFVAPWRARQQQEVIGGFPDLRTYRVDPRAGGSVTFPARATVKQFKVQWAGPPADGWVMPRPVLVPGQRGEPRLWFDGQGRLQGRLVHELPGELQDVLIIVNRGQLSLGSVNEPTRWPRAVAYKLRTWAPNRELDLGTSLDHDESFSIYLDQLLPESSGPSFAGGSGDQRPPGDAAEHLTALSLFHMLPGPEFETGGRMFPLARRWQMHGRGLSRWLTQPCVIVIGHMGLDEPAPSPTPMRAGSGAAAREFRTTGRTVVRWVYPLEGDPPGFEGEGGQ